jgi:hypothetical protein
VHFSKSDFKVARTCGTKPYYRKLRYPSKIDDDSYLEFLADGDYIVETIAKTAGDLVLIDDKETLLDLSSDDWEAAAKKRFGK